MLSEKIAASGSKWIQRDPLPGDHIKVDRGKYSHHAIYIGDGKVVHFNPSPDVDIPTEKKEFRKHVFGGNITEVREDDLDTFIKGRDPKGANKPADYNTMYIKHYSPEQLKHAPPREKVVQNAKKQIGNSGYHFVTDNCEDMADKTILGYSEHGQVKPYIKKYLIMKNKHPVLMKHFVPDVENELDRGDNNTVRNAYKHVYGENLGQTKIAFIDTKGLDIEKRKQQEKQVKKSSNPNEERWVLQRHDQLKPGDHLRVTRGMFYHHGIYISPSEVISFKPDGRDGEMSGGKGTLNPRKKFEAVSKQSKIVSDSLGNFLGAGKTDRTIVPQVQILSKNDQKKLKSTDEIVQRARKAIGHDMGGYNVFGNNCEHFANFVRTGEHRSEQSKGLKEIFNQTSKEMGGKK